MPAPVLHGTGIHVAFTQTLCDCCHPWTQWIKGTAKPDFHSSQNLRWFSHISDLMLVWPCESLNCISCKSLQFKVCKVNNKDSSYTTCIVANEITLTSAFFNQYHSNQTTKNPMPSKPTNWVALLFETLIYLYGTEKKKYFVIAYMIHFIF